MLFVKPKYTYYLRNRPNIVKLFNKKNTITLYKKYPTNTSLLREMLHYHKSFLKAGKLPISRACVKTQYFASLRIYNSASVSSVCLVQIFRLKLAQNASRPTC